jgi:hypothetical protein
LRIAAARGDLWFDEVWNIRIVYENVHKPIDLLLHFKHESNHMLSSLVTHVVGPDGAAWSYRWPAVLFGSATVALAGWVQRRRGMATAFAAVVLCGSSYLLVHYSSEARGYAYQLFFMLLAYAAMWEAEKSRRWKWEVLFTASCILGFLAHPLFLNLYVAAQIWSWLPLPRLPRREIILRALCRTIVPGLFFAWLYWINLRDITIGGGMEDPLGAVMAQVLSLFVGGPHNPPWSYAAAAVTVAVGVAAFWSIAGERRRWSLYLYLILVAPAAVVIASGRTDIYPRYFLGSVLFLCLLWSELAGAIRDRWSDGRLWYRVLLAAFVLANGAHVLSLIRFGRNHYTEALATMDLRTPSDRIGLLVDHPLRHRVMFEYYGPHRENGKPLDFSLPTPEAVGKADWILSHSLDVNFEPPPAIHFKTGEEFRLVEQFPYAGLSGWNLALYRRVDPRPAD